MATSTHGKHKLDFFSVTMIVVSLVIGMGIFKIPALIAATAGTPTIFFAAWIIGGIAALCGALTYAEIGVRLPVMGGYYKVFSHAYHPAVGFTVNALILVSNSASLAIVALIGSDFVSDLLFGRPSGPIFNTVVAVVGVALFYGVNLLGLRTSSRALNIMIVVKIALILLLISSIFTGLQVEPHGYEEAPVYTFTGDNGLLLLGFSLISVSFIYGGYQQTLNFGGEVRSAATMHRGIVAGIFIVLFLYLSINYAYTEVIGFEKMKNASAIGALLCEAWFGTAGAKLFDAAMFLSVLTYVNILLMSNPRVMYAMSEDGVFPKIFSWSHPQTGALIPGLTVFAVSTILVALTGRGVDKILGFTMFLDSIGMCTSAATLFILRRRKQGEEQVQGKLKHFTPFLAGFFVLAYSSVTVAVIIKSPSGAAIGAGLLLFFVAIYFLVFHRKPAQTVENG